jgi:hypothetical protein
MINEIQRNLFETWFLGQGLQRLERDGSGYRYIAAQSAWVSWMAAIEAQPKPAPVLLTETEREQIRASLRRQDGWDGDGWDEAVMRAVESAVLKKNGLTP